MPTPTTARSLVITEANMTEGQAHAAGPVDTFVYSSSCPNTEGPNEDALAVLPCDASRSVLAIADGMGGRPVGNVAANVALAELAESVRRAVSDNLDLREAILNGFDNANRALRELAPGSATTMAVVQIENRVMRPYHAGDCAILVIGRRGRIRLETVAHSPVGYAVQAGMLEADEAMHHEERHLVSNMVGCEAMRIEVGASIELKPSDTVVLATDGLTDNLHVEEIAELVRKGPLDKAAESLCQLGLQRMNHPVDGAPSKPDDLSFILFRPASPAA